MDENDKKKVAMPLDESDKKNGTTSPSRLTERQKDKLAIERAEVILKVQSGELTATEGAAMLKVSRKTYYEWETLSHLSWLAY